MDTYKVLMRWSCGRTITAYVRATCPEDAADSLRFFAMHKAKGRPRPENVVDYITEADRLYAFALPKDASICIVKTTILDPDKPLAIPATKDERTPKLKKQESALAALLTRLDPAELAQVEKLYQRNTVRDRHNAVALLHKFLRQKGPTRRA